MINRISEDMNRHLSYLPLKMKQKELFTKLSLLDLATCLNVL